MEAGSRGRGREETALGAAHSGVISSGALWDPFPAGLCSPSSGLQFTLQPTLHAVSVCCMPCCCGLPEARDIRFALSPEQPAAALSSAGPREAPQTSCGRFASPHAWCPGSFHGHGAPSPQSPGLSAQPHYRQASHPELASAILPRGGLGLCGTRDNLTRASGQ